jgi:toxin ParE1/3/4
MKPLQFHQQAKAEASQAFEWYWQEKESAALGFLTELKDAYRAIQVDVEICPPYLLGTRRKLLNRYPYAVIFRELPRQIQVIAVAHAKRRPGYWASRL